MKKLIFSLLFASISILSFGQKDGTWWIDTGVKIQYGASGILNQALSDSGNWNYDVGTQLSYGGKVGFNYGDNGVTLDVMFGSLEAKYENDINATIQNTVATVDFTDVYLLYRLNKNLGYFELGPKMGLIRGASFENLDNTEAVPPGYEDSFASNYFAAVMGFGAYFIGSDGSFSGILGLRFEYGITDPIDEALASPVGTPVNDPLLYSDGYSSSHPLFAGITFELNWGIGYYGKASCGARSKFVLF